MHPLLAERTRLDRILDIMYAKIQKTLFPRNPQRRPQAGTEPSADGYGPERILYGTGISSDDVLAEALIALLQYPPERLKGTWEGLAVGIAEKKAVDALRVSGRGLRGTDLRTELSLVSGDAARVVPNGERAPSVFEVFPGDGNNPEDEYLVLEAALELRDLIRKALDDREQRVFLAIHFQGYSRKEIGERLSMTGQRIGQIYDDAVRKLESHPDYPFKRSLRAKRMAERRTR